MNDMVDMAQFTEAKSDQLNADDLIAGKFILLQRGKKNYFLVKAV